jgi:3-oxoacyl-[acyl-carrier protein] reductase
MRLQGKVALVTGSSSGIGRATAIALAREGADVAVNYNRSEDGARETASAIEAAGRRVLMVKADVADDRQVREMVERTVAVLGGLDLLVNNAGTTTLVGLSNLEAHTEEVWDRALGVNLKGPFYCARAAAPIMRVRGGGCIVNVASDSGFRPIGSSHAYCASKAGLISLTSTLSLALAPEIRVNAVAPGYIDTPWQAGRPPSRRRHALESTMLQRIGQPEDVAEVIVALITSAGFVTGQVVTVDGGLLPLVKM